jgi:hypothetical protein
MATAQQQAVRGKPSLQVTYGEAPASGMVTFAAVMLGILALFNGLDGISAVYRSHVFVGNAVYVFGDLRTWGWVMIGLAIAQALAAVGVLARNSLARWFGVVVLAFNAFAQMAFIPSYPVWSVLIIALDVVAIFGLTSRWSHAEAYEPALTGTGAGGDSPDGSDPSSRD